LTIWRQIFNIYKTLCTLRFALTIMPTYAYRAIDSEKSCNYCRSGFEVIQRMTEPALTQCPQCKNPVSRILFAPTVVIKGGPLTETDRKIKEYEKEGKWSHAAELADKEAEKTKRDDLKTRALEDYKKAGYNFDKYDT
jgi:putative FmdB family regulatory protein